MRLELDTYAYLRSPLHRWEPRCKLISLMALIFAFSAIHSLILLPLMLGITLLLYILSGLPWSFLGKRLRYPSFFLMGIVLFLPFSAGDTILWQWGILSVRWEGCLAVLIVSTRFFCILVVVLILFGTAPFLIMMQAMGQLGLPPLLRDMMVLTYRYLIEFGDRLATLKIAMHLRGFDPHALTWRQIQTLASLTGTLLVSSYEQSERVYQAMRLRGYGQTFGIMRCPSSLHLWDWIVSGGIVMGAISLAIAQWAIDYLL